MTTRRLDVCLLIILSCLIAGTLTRRSHNHDHQDEFAFSKNYTTTTPVPNVLRDCKNSTVDDCSKRIPCKALVDEFGFAVAPVCAKWHDEFKIAHLATFEAECCFKVAACRDPKYIYCAKGECYRIDPHLCYTNDKTTTTSKPSKAPKESRCGPSKSLVDEMDSDLDEDSGLDEDEDEE